MKKSPIMRQDAQRQRIIAIGAIARATEFFAEMTMIGIGIMHGSIGAEFTGLREKPRRSGRGFSRNPVSNAAG